MLEMIGEVRTCPHGHPIGDYPREPGEALPAVPAGSEITVLRLENEAEEILHYMYRAGVEPGRRYTVASRSGEGDDAVTELEDDGGRSIAVDDRVARTVSVRVEERGDGPVSTLADASAELQLLGADRWGM
jgi:DtxR family Mn-dependent transcriptional regulator